MCLAYFFGPLAELTPCRRHTSDVLAPDSCSRKMTMICSSLNLLFRIVRLLWSDGLYPNLEEKQGLRSGSGSKPERTLVMTEYRSG